MRLRLSRVAGLAVFALGVASAAGYVGVARSLGANGYPLDDAWIHQTYARNLATLGEWSFEPGKTSGGSTSPLWTLLLAAGYVLRMNPRLWTASLGALAHGAVAWLGTRLLATLWPGKPKAALAAGVLMALEWHLVWAAASGMETALFIVLVLSAFIVACQRRFAFWSGVLTGLAVWARPDGLTVLPAVAALAWLADADQRGRLGRLALVTAGAAVVVLPYLAFNLRVADAIWPATFFAKQAEYAVLRTDPLLARFGRLLMRPLTGVLALVAPAVLLAFWKPDWRRLVPLAWGLGYVTVYAVRLPAAYQYGRYVMPAIPVLAVVGSGMAASWLRPGAVELLPRVTGRVWLAASALVLVIFWGIGLQRYFTDVRIIDSEMVATAQWVERETPADALVAAHDIGALGYFGGRSLLDMAGLISPDVVPFIRDEARLAAYIKAQGAAYLVTFPGWYPRIVARPEWQPVFSTGAPHAPAAGGENMAVYVRVEP